ncbi:MAG TPA: acetylglutamate kinase [Dehalococcoidia bacterium]|nr:acetylglutamate kinase [Dehalococcoidia bacterium]
MNPLTIKIGGSTLGHKDTTIEDLVTLQKKGVPLVVVHGGANTVTSWLRRLDIPTSFIRGLRITDLQTLEVVTAVLAGLVNKELVSAIWKLGGKAIGLSGADGGLIVARNKTPELGYTGEELEVDAALLRSLLREGYMPVVAPVSLGSLERADTKTNLLNVNGDTVAGEIAAALRAEKLIFLTDVPGLYDSSGNLIRKLAPSEAEALLTSGVASGGMAAKIEACLIALTTVPVTRIIDGRVPHALINEVEGRDNGTTIG